MGAYLDRDAHQECETCGHCKKGICHNVMAGRSGERCPAGSRGDECHTNYKHF